MNIARKNIIDYYDKLLNQVDIHFEKQIKKNNTNDSQVEELNRIRESFVQQINEVLNFSLNFIKLNSNHNNNDEFFIPKFCFFYGIYCQLVITNKFINDQIRKSLYKYDPNLSQEDQITSIILLSLLGYSKKINIVDLSKIENNKIENFRVPYKQNFFQIAETWLDLSSFKNLQLILEQNEIFPKAALSNLISLEKLRITSENDVLFESDCFQGLEKIYELELNCEMQTIFNRIFSHLNSLRKLKIRLFHRTLFETNCFQGLENLIELYLFGYQFHWTNICFDHLKNLPNLQMLVVHSNNFGPCDLKDLPKLKFVSFKNCALNNLKCSIKIHSLLSFDYSTETDKILEIDKEFFSNAKNLVFLNLSCFILDNFDVTALNVLENLEYLNIKKCIDSSYSFENLNLPKLKYLWIASKTIPKFQHLNLEYLVVENITHFEHRNLSNQTNLIGLVLNKIPCEIFEKLEKCHFSLLTKLIYFQFSFDIDSYNFNSEKCNNLLSVKNAKFIHLDRAYAITSYDEVFLSKLIEIEIHFSHIARQGYILNKKTMFT